MQQRDAVEKTGTQCSAKIIKDSVNLSGNRFTTFELEYPRIVHSEFMTHGMLAKNSSSTRAVPVADVIKRVKERPAMPVEWGENNAGMVSKKLLDPQRELSAKMVWQSMVDTAVSHVAVMSDKFGINGHKQWAGRWLETASYIKVVCSGTEFKNLFWLRDHKDADPTIRELVRCMVDCYKESTPEVLVSGQWHLPYIDFIDGKYYSSGVQVDLETAKKISASCCAQASYRKLDDSVEKAEKVFSMLNLGENTENPAHASPTEHQGTPMSMTTAECNEPFNPSTWEPGISHVTRDGKLWSGKLKGWVQFRKLIPNEAVW